MSKTVDNEDGRIDVSTLVTLLADDPEVRTDPTSYAPTRGRVIEDAADGSVYVGDGEAWVDVDEDVYFDSLAPGLQARNLLERSDPNGVLRMHDGTDGDTTNPRGLAQRVGGQWVSLIDGEAVS